MKKTRRKVLILWILRIPDFNITPTLDDLLNDREYTLEYTLKLIRENKLKKF